MSSNEIKFHMLWIEQCAATEAILIQFGLEDALNYLIGEKLFRFVEASEKNPDVAAQLPAFITEIQRIFSREEIQNYLNHLEQTQYLATTQDLCEEVYHLDEGEDDESDDFWTDDSAIRTQQLLRFSTIKQLLQL